jgi:ribonuclease Z
MLRLTFLGTSAAQPTLQRNLSAIAVRRARELLLFDCGEGTQRQMMRYGTGFSVDAIFFTHFHADHYLGLLGFLRTLHMQGREAPLALFGPAPARTLLDRALHLGFDEYLFPVTITELAAGARVDLDAAVVEAIAVDHGMPALGYCLREAERPGTFHPERAAALGVPEGPLFGKLQHGESVTLDSGRRIDPGEVLGPSRPGRKLVLSGDTRPCDALRNAAQGADLLVHESTFEERDLARAKETRHSTAREAASLAKSAGVKRLALTHFSSRYEERLQQLGDEARAEFPAVELAYDGLTIEVPLSD